MILFGEWFVGRGWGGGPNIQHSNTSPEVPVRVVPHDNANWQHADQLCRDMKFSVDLLSKHYNSFMHTFLFKLTKINFTE